MLEYVKSGDEFAVHDPAPGNQTNPQITPFAA